jgi:hypothetical protein
MDLLAINRLVAIIAINKTTAIFLLKLLIKKATKAKNITAFILLVTIYPKTLLAAKNTMKYRKYLLVTNLDASLAKFIIYIIFKKN